jgi:hypothetical protein
VIDMVLALFNNAIGGSDYRLQGWMTEWLANNSELGAVHNEPCLTQFDVLVAFAWMGWVIVNFDILDFGRGGGDKC